MLREDLRSERASDDDPGPEDDDEAASSEEEAQEEEDVGWVGSHRVQYTHVFVGRVDCCKTLID